MFGSLFLFLEFKDLHMDEYEGSTAKWVRGQADSLRRTMIGLSLESAVGEFFAYFYFAHLIGSSSHCFYYDQGLKGGHRIRPRRSTGTTTGCARRLKAGREGSK